MSTYRLSTGTVDNLQELVGIKGYDSNETYSLNEVVLTVVSDSVLLYRSLENNNTSPLTDDTKWEKVELGGAIDIDGNTITLNSNDEIQTIGVIDSSNNTTSLKLWTGTRSQYDAIQNKDANTLYNITDDTGDLGTFANADLSNLSNAGEAHFANPALSNLSATGQAVLNGKANVDLSNLSAAGQAKFDAKANVANTVTTDTAQTITGFKAFNNGSGNIRTNIDIITNDGVGEEDVNSKWAGSIQFKKGNVDVGFCEAFKDSENSSITQIVAHNSVNGQEVYASLRSVVTSDGNTFSYAETTPTGATGNEIATAAWVNSKIQLVNELPANPVAGVLYCIPEK